MKRETLDSLIDTGRIAPWCEHPVCQQRPHRLDVPCGSQRPAQHARPLRLTARGQRLAAVGAGLLVLAALCAPTLERML